MHSVHFIASEFCVNPASLKFYGSRSSSFVSESGSSVNRESVIVQNPTLPVILEEKEMELKLSNVVEEDILEEEEDESTFGPTVVESKSIIKVNHGATDSD